MGKFGVHDESLSKLLNSNSTILNTNLYLKQSPNFKSHPTPQTSIKVEIIAVSSMMPGTISLVHFNYVLRMHRDSHFQTSSKFLTQLATSKCVCFMSRAD